MDLSSRRSTEDRRAAIAWSPDPVTVEKVLSYCEKDISSTRSERLKLQAKGQKTLRLDAREAILDRIHGNLRNVVHRAYPAEISHETVARELTRDIGDTPEGKTKRTLLLSELDKEWESLNAYFQKNFTKRNLD